MRISDDLIRQAAAAHPALSLAMVKAQVRYFVEPLLTRTTKQVATVADLLILWTLGIEHLYGPRDPFAGRRAAKPVVLSGLKEAPGPGRGVQPGSSPTPRENAWQRFEKMFVSRRLTR